MPVPFKPQGYTAITPWIIGRDTAGLLDFLARAFGAEELVRVPGAGGAGIGHAETRIGDAIVMAFDSPPDWPATPAFIRLYVADADSVFAAAVAAGAIAVTSVTHLPFGDRVGRVRDPFGNLWWLQTHIEDVPAEEEERRYADPKWAAAMDYVQSSAEKAVH